MSRCSLTGLPGSCSIPRGLYGFDESRDFLVMIPCAWGGGGGGRGLWFRTGDVSMMKADGNDDRREVLEENRRRVGVRGVRHDLDMTVFCWRHQGGR